MANNFVSWYFQLLNASATNGITEFSPSHFWPDASAKVELLRGDGAVDESLAVSNNAEEVCQMLVGVMRQDIALGYFSKSEITILEDGFTF